MSAKRFIFIFVVSFVLAAIPVLMTLRQRTTLIRQKALSAISPPSPVIFPSPYTNFPSPTASSQLFSSLPTPAPAVAGSPAPFGVEIPLSSPLIPKSKTPLQSIREFFLPTPTPPPDPNVTAYSLAPTLLQIRNEMVAAGVVGAGDFLNLQTMNDSEKFVMKIIEYKGKQAGQTEEATRMLQTQIHVKYELLRKGIFPK